MGMARPLTGLAARRQPPPQALVTGHRRDGDRIRLWSIRTQLLAPIMVATTGLVVLGTIQTATAVNEARDAARARILAGAATATVHLAHELDRELAESAALRQRGGKSGEALVSAQRARVDLAASRYRGAAIQARRSAAALVPAMDAADVALSGLSIVRAVTITPVSTASGTDRTYQDMVSTLLAVADALPSQLQDRQLATAARAVSAVAAVEHYHALERDLLRPIFSRGTLLPGDLAAIASTDGALRQRESEFGRVAGASARQTYDSTVVGRDIDASERMRRGALAADLDPTGLKVDADAWYSAQSNTIRRLNDVGLTLSGRLDALAGRLSADAYRRAWAIGVGTASLATTALLTAVLLAVRTSRRLRRLRAAALTVARHELPDTIAAANAGEHAGDRTARDSPASATTRSIASSDDEVGELADAFGSVHATALRLASEQAELRIDVVRMAEIFARRIRTLITRQLRLLDEFEREETDPEALSRLFALDHLAARLRRNGENLLVLAGGEPGRPFASAFPLAGAVKAAASEIEDFQRVETEAMDVAIAGSVVGDVVHLLAELLENATTFSAPGTVVRVDARNTVDGVVLRVHDNGIGMSQVRLAEVNARLAGPGGLSSTAAGTMGLYVVAKLANRHGIHVRLYSTDAGIDAYVLLPPEVLAPLWATATSQDAPRLTDASPAATSRAASVTAAAAPATAGIIDPTGPAAAWFQPYLSRSGGPPPRNAPRHGPVNVINTPVKAARWGSPTALPQHRSAIDLPMTGNGTTPDRTGLPKRSPGALLPVPHGETGKPAAAGPVDPDLVRARLSALAEGVSAAVRRGGPSTP